MMGTKSIDKSLHEIKNINKKNKSINKRKTFPILTNQSENMNNSIDNSNDDNNTTMNTNTNNKRTNDDNNVPSKKLKNEPTSPYSIELSKQNIENIKVNLEFSYNIFFK